MTNFATRALATLAHQAARKARSLNPTELGTVDALRKAPDLATALKTLEDRPEIPPLSVSLHVGKQLDKVRATPYYQVTTPPGASISGTPTRVNLSLDLQEGGNPGLSYEDQNKNSINLRVVESFPGDVTRSSYYSLSAAKELLAATGGQLTPTKLAATLREGIEHPERSHGLEPEGLLKLTRAVHANVKNDHALSANEITASITPLLDAFQIPVGERTSIVQHVVTSLRTTAVIEREAFEALSATGKGFKLGD